MIFAIIYLYIFISYQSDKNNELFDIDIRDCKQRVYFGYNITYNYK